MSVIMAKPKTTVIFIDGSQQVKKPLLIPSFYLYYWKLITVVLTISTSATVYGIIWMGNQYLLQHQKELLISKEEFKNETEKLKIQQDFFNKKIDEVISLLEVKGIHLIKPSKSEAETQSDPTPFELTSNDHAQVNFLNKIQYFKSALIHTPIGYPIDGTVISNYGKRANPFHGQNSEFHGGLDISARHGAPVKTTAKGKVIFAGTQSGYGKLVIIDHDDQFQTFYAHLSEIMVKKGQKVDTNEVVGKVGATGRATGPHLHYEIRENDKTLNPQTYLSAK
jgi:murein DD-endopeptidase MepM/ murein hydrolase activator NlpD